MDTLIRATCTVASVETGRSRPSFPRPPVRQPPLPQGRPSTSYSSANSASWAWRRTTGFTIQTDLDTSQEPPRPRGAARAGAQADSEGTLVHLAERWPDRHRLGEGEVVDRAGGRREGQAHAPGARGRGLGGRRQGRLLASPAFPPAGAAGHGLASAREFADGEASARPANGLRCHRRRGGLPRTTPGELLDDAAALRRRRLRRPKASRGMVDAWPPIFRPGPAAPPLQVSVIVADSAGRSTRRRPAARPRRSRPAAISARAEHRRCHRAGKTCSSPSRRRSRQDTATWAMPGEARTGARLGDFAGSSSAGGRARRGRGLDAWPRAAVAEGGLARQSIGLRRAVAWVSRQPSPRAVQPRSAAYRRRRAPMPKFYSTIDRASRGRPATPMPGRRARRAAVGGQPSSSRAPQENSAADGPGEVAVRLPSTALVRLRKGVLREVLRDTACAGAAGDEVGLPRPAGGRMAAVEAAAARGRSAEIAAAGERRRHAALRRRPVAVPAAADAQVGAHRRYQQRGRRRGRRQTGEDAAPPEERAGSPTSSLVRQHHRPRRSPARPGINDDDAT